MKRKRPIPRFLPPGLRAFRERRLPMQRWEARPIGPSIFDAATLDNFQRELAEALMPERFTLSPPSGLE